MEEGACLHPLRDWGKLPLIGCLHLLCMASQARPSNSPQKLKKQIPMLRESGCGRQPLRNTWLPCLLHLGLLQALAQFVLWGP